MKKKIYVSPTAEIIRVKIEKGFAVSQETEFGLDNQAGYKLYQDDWAEF